MFCFNFVRVFSEFTCADWSTLTLSSASSIQSAIITRAYPVTESYKGVEWVEGGRVGEWGGGREEGKVEWVEGGKKGEWEKMREGGVEWGGGREEGRVGWREGGRKSRVRWREGER